MEMLTTVAALVILGGLMVSLARDVRARSANALTADILSKLELLMQQYQHRAGGLPAVAALSATEQPAPGEPLVQAIASSNNTAFVRALRTTVSMERQFGQLQLETFTDTAIHDAWGEYIVFMPEGHPAIGMAPQNRSFFFSAGPDRRYLTRDDNLYSYERQPFAGGEPLTQKL